MKIFAHHLLILTGLLLVLGGAALVGFDVLSHAMPTILRLSNTMDTVEASGMGLLLLVHMALAMSVLPAMPSPDDWSGVHTAKALALGGSAMVFLAMGLPILGFHAPDHAVVVSVEMIAGIYGGLFGLTVIIVALSAATFQGIDVLLDTMDNLVDELGHALRQKRHGVN